VVQSRAINFALVDSHEMPAVPRLDLGPTEPASSVSDSASRVVVGLGNAARAEEAMAGVAATVPTSAAAARQIMSRRVEFLPRSGHHRRAIFGSLDGIGGSGGPPRQLRA
jgi:hypothetical protein